jgi:glyceraldehyde-3-phosphate dehydrogenase/erythrose-4-phosphate dehydrogenase
MFVCALICVCVVRCRIKTVHTRKPDEVPWGALGVDYLAEASGVFLTAEGAEPHVKVIVCMVCVCVRAGCLLASVFVCIYECNCESR